MKCLTLFVAARWIYYLRASLKKSTNCCCHYLLCFGLYTGPAKNLSHTRCPLRCFTPAIPVDFFLLILLHQLILYIWELRTALDQLILCCAASSAAAEMFHFFRADSKNFKVWTPVLSAPTHNITIKAQLKLRRHRKLNDVNFAQVFRTWDDRRDFARQNQRIGRSQLAGSS